MTGLATVLYLCINPTWLACTVSQATDYGSVEACQAALSSMVVQGNGKLAVGGEGKQVIAYCRPPFSTVTTK